MEIFPGTVGGSVLKADGNVVIPLVNVRGNRNTYTVHIYGTFGGGTVTAFTNPVGVEAARLGTTYDIAVLDASGAAISKTANAAFDMECNSDTNNPTALKLILAGSTSPSLTFRICNAA